MCARCPYHAFDYCLRCQTPLCEICMKAGCCGDTPAGSGVEKEFMDNWEAVEAGRYGDLGLPREDLV
jgi:hypothetical protein